MKTIYQVFDFKQQDGTWYREFEVPEDFPIQAGFITDPPPANLVTPRYDAFLGWIEDEATQLENVLQQSAAYRTALTILISKTPLSDSEAVAMAEFYPDWAPGVTYTSDDVKSIVRFQDHLYRIVQPHTSQEDWLPPMTDSLYSLITIGADGIELWKQPTGGHDAYGRGVKVRHSGKIWESLRDGNIWEPGGAVESWKEVAE